VDPVTPLEVTAAVFDVEEVKEDEDEVDPLGSLTQLKE
jgi:hypothetical protein